MVIVIVMVIEADEQLRLTGFHRLVRSSAKVSELLHLLLQRLRIPAQGASAIALCAQVRDLLRRLVGLQRRQCRNAHARAVPQRTTDPAVPVVSYSTN